MSKMKVVIQCLLLVLVSCTIASSLLQPSLCDESCGCMDGAPFIVDCTEMSLTEITLMSAETYEFPWIVFLGNNFLTHVPVIPRQDELLQISFRMNHISSIADSAFANLIKLQSIELTYCNLTKGSFTHDAFRGPTNAENKHDPIETLTKLDISHNDIEELDNHAFNHLILLQELYMTDNPLHDLTRQTTQAFSELRNLVKLDLSRNKLVRLPHQFLAGMRKLEELVLTGNLMMVVPEEVSFAKFLKKLNLDNNPILTISPDSHSAFHGPKTLTDLSISYSPCLERVEREAFRGLDNLRRLTMTNNPNLQYIDKLAFLSNVDSENNLKEVYLGHNALTTLDRELLDWNNLDILDLEHNPWVCDCHLKWIVEGPMQSMIITEPQFTRYIVCAEPPSQTGVNIKHLMAFEYDFPCWSADKNTDSNFYNPLIIITIFIGVLLLVSSTMLCTFVLYQRTRELGLSSRTVHYRRAKEQDLESIAQSIEA